MVGHLVEELVIISNDVPDDLTDEEREQVKEDLNKIDEKTKKEKVAIKVKEAVKSVRAAADFLDEVWTKHKIAHAWGSFFGIIGGICTLGGGIATLMTAGVASPLLYAGIGIGVTGAGTGLVAKIIEYAVNSDEIQKANNDLKEAYDSIGKVQKFIKVQLNGKKKPYLQYMYNFSAFVVSPSLRFLVAYFCYTGIVEATKQTVAQAAGKAGAQAAGKAGAQAAVKAGTQAAGKGGAQAASEAGAQAAVKASGQVADDVVQVGVKSSSQFAGKVIIGVSAVMLAWEAVDLSFTIYDLVKKKGSEAADVLREEADKLEEQYIKDIDKIDYGRYKWS